MNLLSKKIIEQIKSKPISFHDFMKMSLYDSEFGYYFSSKEKIGRSGDFYTSSNISSVFGSLLAKQCLEMHCKLINIPLEEIHKSNRILTIIEVGAGTGQLAFDILYALENEYDFPLKRVEYLIQEISPLMQLRQQNLLAPFAAQVQWISFDKLENHSQRAIIIANEVIDAFPVYQFRWCKNELEELFIDTDGVKLWDQGEPVIVDEESITHANTTIEDLQIFSKEHAGVRFSFEQGRILIHHGNKNYKCDNEKDLASVLECIQKLEQFKITSKGYNELTN